MNKDCNESKVFAFDLTNISDLVSAMRLKADYDNDANTDVDKEIFSAGADKILSLCDIIRVYQNAVHEKRCNSKEGEKSLLIAFKDGRERIYSASGYDDYHLSDNIFIVMKDEEYVGIYNFDSIAYVEKTVL